jgi:hypothetical protein
MLKQTVESADRKQVLNLGGKGSLLNLGGLKDIMYGHGLSKPREFGYGWKDLSFQTQGSKEPNELCFNAIIGAETWPGTLSVDSLSYKYSNSGRERFCVDLERNKSDIQKFFVNSTNYLNPADSTKRTISVEPVHFYGFSGEFFLKCTHADLISTLALAHEVLFHSLVYIGPIRAMPERLYAWTGNEPESVGVSGEWAIAALLAGKERKYALENKYFGLNEMAAYQLQKLGLIDEFRIIPIQPGEQIYQVEVKQNRANQWVELADVGTGVSQVLPIVTEAFYALPHAIISMDEPEQHLHPSAQALLADVLIDAVKAKEDNKNRNTQFVIETHSEYFLQRLLRRIAEGTLSEKEVAAYFVNTDVSGAHLDTLQIDEYGHIHNWPDNFFGDEMGDITAQTDAILERKRDKEQQETK